MENASAPGFYGKLPGRGDFVSRRLPRSFLDPWDRWLQESLSVSRKQLGKAWLDSYLISPIWRFVMGAGTCGSAAMAGVMMPSVDRVGRYFPLMIALELTNSVDNLRLLVEADPWFEAAEQLALRGLQDDLDLDDFDQRVSALGAPPLPLPESTLGDSAGGLNTAWYCPLNDLDDIQDSLALLTGHLVRRVFPLASVWWSRGSEEIEPCLLVCEGLPPSEGFAAMLKGDWQQAGWSTRSLRNVQSTGIQTEEPET